MKGRGLEEVSGSLMREWHAWLRENGCGCCSLQFADTDMYRYFVCMGWHDMGEGGWSICWKIGRQTRNSAMQCDLDLDFEMPFVTEGMAKADGSLVEGDVDDTLEVVGNPVDSRGWDALAADMRKEARRVFGKWSKMEREGT